MVYVGNEEKKCPAQYMKYQTSSSDFIIDDERNILIVPERHTNLLVQYKKIRKAIWWLSVNNYQLFGKTGFVNGIKNLMYPYFISGVSHFRFGRFSKDVRHIVQSRYADWYIRKMCKRIPLYISDYLNDVFIERSPTSFTSSNRTNTVLYNPKKGFETVQELIKRSPEIDWRPLSGLTPEGVQYLMSTAKLYVDFGSHPGKDRIPREAAIQGCCVITGKQGSAAFKEDVPIPEEYKFDSNTTAADIVSKINHVLNEYDSCIEDFSFYREVIRNEKEIFISSVDSVFVQS